MKIAPVADVKARFSGFLESCKEGPVVVTKNGRPVAVLVAVGVGEEDELERLVLAHTPRFRRLLEKAKERIDADGGVPHEEFWASVRARTKRNAKSR
jgi:prevent-host-death family protein